MGDGEAALLWQDDVFFTQLAPRETLELAIILQLSHTPAKERHVLITKIMDSLGLGGVQQRRIEDQRHGSLGGLSGGERKRLSVALELVTDMVSIDTEDPIQASKDLQRFDHLHTSFTQNNTQSFAKRIDTLQTKPTPQSRRQSFMMDKMLSKMNFLKKEDVGIIKRFVVLFLRAWRQNVRDHKNNFIRLAAAVGQAFLFATIFKGVKPGPPTAVSLADCTALISFGVINMSMNH